MIAPYLRIGQIVRPHGVKGAVKLNPETDDVSRFKNLTNAYLELHGTYAPVRLSVLSASNTQVLLHVEGIDTPEAAETLRNVFLCVDRENAVKLPEKTWFVTDLVGLEVSDTEGKTYGKVTDVYTAPGANDVYEIAGGKLVVPALKKLVVSVDTEAGNMVLDAAVLRETGLFEEGAYAD